MCSVPEAGSIFVVVLEQTLIQGNYSDIHGKGLG